MKLRVGCCRIYWDRLVPMIIILAGTLAYTGSFSGAFIFDDVHTIRTGYRVWQSWLSNDGSFFSWRPVTNATFALNYAFSHLKAADYHAVNLAIHLIAALLLYGIVRRTLHASRFTFHAGPGSVPAWLAGIIAAIWVVHPLTTASVTYISQRYESLMGMFYLLTLYCVIRGATSRRGTWWYPAAVLSCVLGMGSKEVMITAPVTVLLYDWMFFAEGSFRQLFRKRWGLYAGLAGTWLVLALLMNVKLQLSETAFYVWKGVSPLAYATTQFGVICRYLQLAVWPVGLCFDYGWPVAEKMSDVLLPGLIVGLLMTVTVIAVYRRSGWGFAGAWFFLILAPTSSFVPRPDAIVEHRMYLPLAGVIVLLVMGSYGLCKRIFHRSAKYEAFRSQGSIIVLIVIVAALSTATVQRNRVYSSTETMWCDVIAKRPDNHRAYLNLACALLDQKKISEAAVTCSNLLARLPDFSSMTAENVPAYTGNAHGAGLYVGARHYAHAHNYLGVACAKRGLPDEAVAHFQEALRLMPQFTSARDNLSLALAKGNQEGRPAGK